MKDEKTGECWHIFNNGSSTSFATNFGVFKSLAGTGNFPINDALMVSMKVGEGYVSVTGFSTPEFNRDFRLGEVIVKSPEPVASITYSIPMRSQQH